jgi:C4-dicarboxylate-binding protein DctP
MRAMVWHENGGYRNYSANKPLTSVEDLQGLKIRTMNNPVHMEIVKSLGASPTPIPWQDLYTALQTGVVDGQENSLAIFRIPKLEEVQKNIIMDGHVYSPGALYFSQKWLDTLPEDLLEIVKTASENFRDLNREISTKAEADDRAYLESKGVSIYDPTPEQKQQFRELTQAPALEYIKGSVDADILACVLSAADEVVCEDLLRRHVDLSFGMNALMWACRLGRVEVVAYILGKARLVNAEATAGEEARDRPNIDWQDKIHRGILRGLSNISETP